MRGFLLSLIMVVCLFSTSLAQDSFRIVGNLGGTLGGDLVLVKSDSVGFIKLGDALMADGSFEFVGSVDGVVLAYILTSDQKPIATLMLENKEYNIVAGEKGIDILGGGESQQILNKFNELRQLVSSEKLKVEQDMRNAYSEQNQTKIQVLQQQFGKFIQEMGDKQMALFREYKDSPVSAYMLATTMGQLDGTSLQAAFDSLGVNAQQSIYGKAICDQIAAYKQVEPGAIAPDFSANTYGGDTISLYGLNAKVKLIDFWASWCAPCRQEMPNVKKIYNKYHSRGLEIIGVSIDQKVEDWIKAMNEDGMEWKNVVDLNSSLASVYLVRAIPHTLLLDENNRIIAVDLRGKELESKIAELLSE